MKRKEYEQGINNIVEHIKYIENNIPKNCMLVRLGKGDYNIIDDQDYIIDHMPDTIDFALKSLNQLDEDLPETPKYDFN
ncbi:MAG TPA: hypothetical protein DEG71_09375 [Clostridiales bacterium]|nr:hypothetical protein [Clostridiales bacterium]